MKLGVRLALALLVVAVTLPGQTTGSILGTVTDQSTAAVASAKVLVRNLDTNQTKEVITGVDGTFRVPQLAIGSYEVVVEAKGFTKYVQGPIVLRLNQDADLTIQLKVGNLTETVSVTSDAALVNTTNAEVGVNFDVRRITELPLAPNRNVLNLALSVAGVSQLSNGNSGFADGGVSFSVNGARTRSNNFMVDGGDINSPSVGGATQQINNPDTVAEFRLITNQFLAEYGRAAGSVVNIISKSGTNQFHGSAYWFNNNNRFNSRSNLDERVFPKAPFRNENQFAGTFGGPVIKDKTFFFVSALRWTDRQFASGTAIGAAPTQAGKDLINQLAGNRPQVRALLNFLPAAQTGSGQTVPLTVGDRSVAVPVGTLSGAAPNLLNAWQWSIRGDHRFNDKHSMFLRYQADTRETVGGQAVPAGLTSVNPQERNLAVFAFNSSFSPNVFNELRLSFNRQNSITNASDTRSESIPSIEVSQLGLIGFNAAASRTAIGLALNLPQSGTFNNYQIANNFSILKGRHSMKFGFDFRRQDQFTVFNPTLRGRLLYPTLQNLVDDQAQVAQINSPLPGVPTKQYYQYYDYFFFLQDEFRVNKSLTLTYGLRYESPGNALNLLQTLNDSVVARYNNNPDFRVDPLPGRDTNNWAGRFGFNYRLPKVKWLTGDNTVLRGGYSRTYDIIFNNMALNVFSSFPFTLITAPAPNVQVGATRLIGNAFGTIDPIRAGTVFPAITNPRQIVRTTVDSSFRAPLTEQFAFQMQRELSKDWVMTAGWVGTKGTALFQSLDGNPTIPGSGGQRRVDNTRGVIRQRANSASSIYHSLQVSLEKRLSRNFSMATHYTWSSFIDDASEVFNASVAGEVAVPQDSFNRRADRGRSTYDRPHRFVVNGVWETPWFRNKKNLAGYALGGWQVSGFLTFQSGSPFAPLNGADPGNRLTGIDGLIGNSIRPNLNTNLDLSRMTLEQLWNVPGGPRSLFSQVTAANPIGNAGRNILRSDGIGNLDVAVNKSFTMPWGEAHRLNLRMEMYNATNTRNFGIPNASVNNPAFGNQWLTDGGNRRIIMGLRYTF
jgi:hypothetical protein